MTARPTPADHVAALAILAQEQDESARSFEKMAFRQPGGSVGTLAARNFAQDAARFRALAAACRAGMAALAAAETQPQLETT